MTGFILRWINITQLPHRQNEKNLKKYQEQIGASGLAVERGLRLTHEDKLRRDAITKVMCDLQLDMVEFGRVWQLDFASHFADTLNDLQPLVADGFVEVNAERIRVTDLGRLFLRNIAMCFDPYLKQASENGPRYSRTA